MINVTSKESFLIFRKSYLSVATPSINTSNGVTKYEILGAVVTLTCTSTSDPAGTGLYEWKLDDGTL